MDSVELETFESPIPMGRWALIRLSKRLGDFLKQPPPSKLKKGPSRPFFYFGGEGGIRTLDTLPYTRQACAFDHSATSPWRGSSTANLPMFLESRTTQARKMTGAKHVKARPSIKSINTTTVRL